MLHITHKEDSGFHFLQSLITFFDKGDQIKVVASDTFSLRIVGEFSKDLPIEGNLVLKAAEWLGSLYPMGSKASITLTKNLPLSSGIGGGSSDAATTIAALLKLWNVQLDPLRVKELLKASGELGADIPVCLAYHLYNRNFFWINGSGKEGDPIPLWSQDSINLHMVLVNPGVSVSTPSIFKAYDKVYDAPVVSPSKPNELLDFLKKAKNSLAPAACELAPEITQVLHSLSNTNGCLIARMSGSGATCFGLYETTEQAQAACKIIKEAHPKWWVIA